MNFSISTDGPAKLAKTAKNPKASLRSMFDTLVKVPSHIAPREKFSHGERTLKPTKPQPLPNIQKQIPLETTLPPVPESHRVKILAALDVFRKEHGQKLKELGWNRDNLFLGLDVATAQTYDTMPCIPLVLEAGARLVYADVGRLEFLEGGEVSAWIKKGFWLGGPALEVWVEEWEERAAIIEYEGGQSRETAEASAAGL